MSRWILVWPGVIVLIILIVITVGRARETARANRVINILIDSGVASNADDVYLNSISELPPPVSRYFKHVLANDQKLIKILRMHQSGLLRTSTKTDAWYSFSADQVVVPPAIGFVWNAKVEMPMATSVRILDSYNAGIGAGRVSLLSAITVASDSAEAELNSAALHRYLAEAVWYPTALLPQSGVVWTPATNNHSAVATLTDSGVTVSLEFRFNDDDEVIAIYSPGRFARLDGGYKKMPWEGHFRNYQIRSGMRIPMYGEVGWYEDGKLQLVWKGDVIDLEYQF